MGQPLLTGTGKVGRVGASWVGENHYCGGYNVHFQKLKKNRYKYI